MPGLGSRAWKLTGVDLPARFLALRPEGAVYGYRFDWDEQPALLGISLSTLLGASHGFEIPFVFGHFDLGPRANLAWSAENRPGREALYRTMSSYWAAFARDGDPGRGLDGSLPRWTARTPDRREDLVLDTPAGGGPRMARVAEPAEAIAQDVLADPSFRDDGQRCAVVAWLADRAPEVLGVEFYGRQAACAGFDYEERVQAGPH